MTSLPKAYLAGGMHSNWRAKVKKAIPQIIYYDPTTTGLKEPKEYTIWDLQAIKDCDIVFVYMDTYNPSGIGLSLEMGFAHALAKTIIFVENLEGDFRGKYFDMHRNLNIYSHCLNLDSGIASLKRYCHLEEPINLRGA